LSAAPLPRVRVVGRSAACQRQRRAHARIAPAGRHLTVALAARLSASAGVTGRERLVGVTEGDRKHHEQLSKVSQRLNALRHGDSPHLRKWKNPDFGTCAW